MGHLHLHVGDIERALAFYRDVLGFEVQANLGSAAFVSAGGYHHHLGINVWNGQGVDGPPPHTTGLRRWTVQLPTDADVAELRECLVAGGQPVEPIDGGFDVRDPWGTALAVARREDRIGPRQGRRRSHERAAERPRTQARLARGRGARPGRPPPLRARQLAAGRRPIEP